MGGQMQTVPRAELRAMFAVVDGACYVPTTVLIDCQGVVNGMNVILEGGTAWGRDHWDLWQVVEEKIKAMPDRANLRVRKVKAHLPREAVDKGLISLGDWELNDVVDEEAKQQGKTHRPPAAMNKAVYERIGCTIIVQ